MLTIEKIKSDHDEIDDIHLDMDDQNPPIFYLKQNDDWICMTEDMVIDLWHSIVDAGAIYIKTELTDPEQI